MTVLTENSISAALAIGTIALADSFLDTAIVRLVADDAGSTEQDFKQSTTTRELVTDDVSEDNVTAWLAGLTAATTAKVHTFYDQSGNAANLVPTVADQPTIADLHDVASPISGFIPVAGGIPLDDTIITLRDFSVLAASNCTAATGLGPIVGTDAGFKCHLRTDSTTFHVRIGSATLNKTAGTFFNRYDTVTTSGKDVGGTVSAHFSGRPFDSTAANIHTANPSSLTLGADAQVPDTFTGRIGAVIFTDNAVTDATMIAAHRDLMRDSGAIGTEQIVSMLAADGLDDAAVLGGDVKHFAACQENGIVYWFVNNDDRTFTQKTVRGTSVIGAKCEGLAWWFLDGQWNIAVLDQANGEIRLYTPDVPGSLETTTWTETVILTGKLNLQDAQAWDIAGDGILQLVYTWEGNGAATGGVHALGWDGVGALTNPASFSDVTMTTLEGAWWLHDERGDWAGNGREDILLTCRGTAKNAASVSGVYYIAEPATFPGATPWAATALYTDVTADILHLDVGNFAGNTNDVAFVSSTPGNEINFLNAGSAWARTTVSVPTANGANLNILKLRYKTNGRDALFVTGQGETAVWEYDGTAYVQQGRSVGPTKMDDRIIQTPITGLDYEPLIVVDSTEDAFGILDWPRNVEITSERYQAARQSAVEDVVAAAI